MRSSIQSRRCSSPSPQSRHWRTHRLIRWYDPTASPSTMRFRGVGMAVLPLSKPRRRGYPRIRGNPAGAAKNQVGGCPRLSVDDFPSFSHPPIETVAAIREAAAMANRFMGSFRRDRYRAPEYVIHEVPPDPRITAILAACRDQPLCLCLNMHHPQRKVGATFVCEVAWQTGVSQPPAALLNSSSESSP